MGINGNAFLSLMSGVLCPTLCEHCGNPVPDGATNPRFCCVGCAYVFELLHSEGLDKFYELRGEANLNPVPVQALRGADDTWLKELAAVAESQVPKGQAAHLQLGVQGLSCIGCVWLIDKIFRQSPGALRCAIYPARGTMVLDWKAGEFDFAGFAARVRHFGYLVGKWDGQSKPSHLAPLTKRLGLCGAFAMNAMFFSLPAYLGMPRDFMFASCFDLVAACSATLSLLVGGSYFAERSWGALRRGVLHIDTPIALGVAIAWTGSMIGWLGGYSELKYFDFVGIFVFLMLAGRWLQQAAVERNQRRLLAFAAAPEKVELVEADGKCRTVALTEMRPGDLLRLPPGAVCPVEGQLRSGRTSLSLEWINGESEAAVRTLGQVVPSGALNIGTEDIEVQVREPWVDSLLERLIRRRSDNEENNPVGSALLRYYLVLVVLVGLGAGLGWWWAGAGVARALQVMISVFVVSCPCALGVAAPLADDLAMNRMQRQGVFVRTYHLWQRLLRVKKVVFDKTGTLTLENPVLKNPGTLDELTAEECRVLGWLVSSNLHPVSRCLWDAIGLVGGAAFQADGVEEVIGQGLRWRDATGTLYALGRPGWRGGDDGAPLVMPQDGADAEFSKAGRVLACFQFTDALRPASQNALEDLRGQGMDIFLLSGDRRPKVAEVASALNIPSDHWQAEMTPQEKAHVVRDLKGNEVLYVGDGANDSLALEESLCSGSPVTGRNFLEHKADFFFLGRSLSFVPELLRTARLRRRAIWRVFSFAVCYNVGTVLLSITGNMSPLVAAILMPLSSLLTLALVTLSYSRGEPGQLSSKSSQRVRQSAQTQRSLTPASASR